MKKTCLLIDDDEDDQEIFKIALQRSTLNFDFLTADSGTDALQLLQQKPEIVPDYILLDLNMPGMDGKQTLAELKKMHHLSHTPVIIYTTSSYIGDIKETKRLGADNYIVKPGSLTDLITIIKNTLK